MRGASFAISHRLLDDRVNQVGIIPEQAHRAIRGRFRLNRRFDQAAEQRLKRAMTLRGEGVRAIKRAGRDLGLNGFYPCA